MLVNEEILLVCAAYLRKSNHPTETDMQIMMGVVQDLAKVRAALKVLNMSELDRGVMPGSR